MENSSNLTLNIIQYIPYITLPMTVHQQSAIITQYKKKNLPYQQKLAIDSGKQLLNL